MILARIYIVLKHPDMHMVSGPELVTEEIQRTSFRPWIPDRMPFNRMSRKQFKDISQKYPQLLTATT